MNHCNRLLCFVKPHRWQGRHDTKVTLARFVRDKTTKDEDEQGKPTVATSMYT